MWLGPAPRREFDPFRCIYNFRWFWDYSGGQMTNWGAHHLDIARWIVNADAPTEISGFGGRYALTDGGETPDVHEVIYQFPKVVVAWTSSEISEAKPFTLDIFGSKGMMSLTRAGFQVTPEMKAPPGSKEKQPLMEPLQAKGVDSSAAHVRNFLDCVKSRRRPKADVEEGHRSAVMCHLGNISMRLGRSIRWDSAAEQAIGDPEASHMLSRPYRAPWKLA
jgi:predicted dehydrogenase